MSSVNDWDQARELVRDRLDFVGLVEEYVSLEERGKGYWGLCPFHTEETPSFTVTPSMGIFKCFGCGEGGDVFDFFMQIENCSFKEALSRLASRVDVDLPESNEAGQSSYKERLLAVTRYARDRYREAFKSEVGEIARKYMLDRGYNGATLKKFEVGYAPEGWRNLIKALERDGYELEHAAEVGLIRTSDSGRVYDAFRNRIVFPIRNPGGDVVAFGGRVMDSNDEDVPKYINSPDSPIFHKRKVLFGLPEARRTIRDTGRCLLVEGYTDVMMCHQEGFQSAVATLGTALTEQHVLQLKRLAEELVLVYDGDSAGQRAARKGGQLALENGLQATVVLISEEQDPADLLEEGDPREFEARLENRRSFFEFFVEGLIEEYSLGNAESKERILREVQPLLSNLSSVVKREEMVSLLAERVDLREEVVRGVLERQRKDDSSERTKPQSASEGVKKRTGELIEEVFFRSLIQHPEQLEEVLDLLSVEDFVADRNQELMSALFDLQESDRSFGGENWMDFADEEYSAYLAGLLSWNEESRLAEGTDPIRIAQKIKTLDSTRRERAELSRELARQDDQIGAGDLDESKKLLLEEVTNLKSREERDRTDSSES